MKQINQELEQHLRFFTEHRQRNWPEWLTTADFVVNNKVHIITRVLPFIENYGRELRMRADIRRKEKSREGNRVCRKDKESTRKSRGSTEKSVGKYKKIGR